MPRTGGVYSPPAGTKGVSNTTIQSVPYNALVDDLTADANAARPVTAGGTGATSASAARTALGLAIGTNVQAYDAGLQSIAGLTTAADRMIYTTASDVYATTALTPFARTLLDDAAAANARTTLELGTAATQNTGTSGANIPLLNAANTWSAAQTLTGGSEILALRSANVGAGTVYIRFRDVNDTAIGYVGLGSTTNDSLTLGRNFDGVINIAAGVSGTINFTGTPNFTTAVPVSSGGTGAITDSAARTNLGLGTAAVKNTGTSGDAVPLLNGANLWNAQQQFSGGTEAIRLNSANVGAGPIIARFRDSAGSALGYIGVNSGTDTITVASNVAGGDVSVLAGSGGDVSLIGSTLTFTGTPSFGTAVPVGSGGTGATTAATARTNLGLGSLATLSSVNNTNWSGTDLSVANGGTGASDAATARTNLGLGGLAVMNIGDLYYTGSTSTLTDYPLGTILWVMRESAPFIARNATGAVYYRGADGSSFSRASAGNILLSGTWVCRGTDGDPAGLISMQRIA